MKSKFIYYLMFALVLSLVMVFIKKNDSAKGKWSQSDKNKFREYLGKEKGIVSMLGEDKANQFIECCLNKTEAENSSFSEVKSDLEGGKKIGSDCFIEISSIGSFKGNWTSQLNKK